MITNERQYKVTKAAARWLQEGLEAAQEREPSANVDPRIHTAMQDGIRSQLGELNEQLADYERLRRGEIRARVFKTLSDITQYAGVSLDRIQQVAEALEIQIEPQVTYSIPSR